MTARATRIKAAKYVLARPLLISFLEMAKVLFTIELAVRDFTDDGNPPSRIPGFPTVK